MPDAQSIPEASTGRLDSDMLQAARESALRASNKTLFEKYRDSSPPWEAFCAS